MHEHYVFRNYKTQMIMLVFTILSQFNSANRFLLNKDAFVNTTVNEKNSPLPSFVMPCTNFVSRFYGSG